MLIWLTKGIYGRWNGQGKKIVEPKLVSAGPDRLGGSITNLLDKPLKKSWLVWKNQVFDLGTIEPGATKSLESVKQLLLSGEIERMKSQSQNRGSFNGQLVAGSGNLENLVRAMMFNNATPANTETVPSVMFHDLDLTGLAELERPMLVAEVEDSGAILEPRQAKRRAENQSNHPASRDLAQPLRRNETKRKRLNEPTPLRSTNQTRANASDDRDQRPHQDVRRVVRAQPPQSPA